jgi:molecular chaperone DnaK
VKEFFGREPHKGVNPDEVVAMGAAIQAGVLQGDVKDVLLLDVTPLSLGIETLGGVFTRLIDRNTTIPTKKGQVFSTAEDSQNAVTIRVFQGEREMAADNKMLGQFDLVGIPPAPRGVPQIEVTFDIDANGIVSVSARDLGTNKEQTVRVTAHSGLSDRDIQRIITEAEEQRLKDEDRKDVAEARLEAESLLYTSERAAEEYGGVVSRDDLALILSDIAALREAVAGEDPDRIRELKTQLESSAFRIAEAMYTNVQPADDAMVMDCAPPEEGDGKGKD